MVARVHGVRVTTILDAVEVALRQAQPADAPDGDYSRSPKAAYSPSSVKRFRSLHAEFWLAK